MTIYRRSDEESLAAQVFEKDIYNIRETLKGLDRERLKRTVSLLCEAESICGFRGFGELSLWHIQWR